MGENRWKNGLNIGEQWMKIGEKWMLKNGKAASDSMISPFLEGFQVTESCGDCLCQA